MRRLATLLFRWSAWLAALACVPGGTLWALTPLGTHLADQRLPAGSDRFWQLFSTAPLLLLVGLAGLWWLDCLGSGRFTWVGLAVAGVGICMIVLGNIGQFWFGLDDLFTLTAPAYRAFRIGLLLLALGGAILGITAARDQALPVWGLLPFAVAVLCGLAAFLQDLGDLGAGLWSAFGAGWIWLGFSGTLAHLLTNLRKRKTKISDPQAGNAGR